MSRPPTPPELRFWPKVEFTGFCWLWSGSLDRCGYGKFYPVSLKTVCAHRWSYEFLVGPVPEGLQLDHLCRNRACVNPDHLEPVTKAENQWRGVQGVLRTRCKNGHPLTPDNIYSPPSRPTVRSCRTCRKEGRPNYRPPCAPREASA